MTDRNVRALSLTELDTALTDAEEQLRANLRSGAAAPETAALEARRRRILDEFRRRGL